MKRHFFRRFVRLIDISHLSCSGEVLASSTSWLLPLILFIWFSRRVGNQLGMVSGATAYRVVGQAESSSFVVAFILGRSDIFFGASGV